MKTKNPRVSGEYISRGQVARPGPRASSILILHTQSLKYVLLGALAAKVLPARIILCRVKKFISHRHGGAGGRHAGNYHLKSLESAFVNVKWESYLFIYLSVAGPEKRRNIPEFKPPGEMYKAACVYKVHVPLESSDFANDV